MNVMRDDVVYSPQVRGSIVSIDVCFKVQGSRCVCVYMGGIFLISNPQTCYWKSQLSASYLGICSVPSIIAYSAPNIAVTDLHTPLSGSASLQSDGSISARGSSAPHSSIFNVRTVIASERRRAIDQSAFSSTTLNIG